MEAFLRHLPEGEPIFSEDELTDQTLRVLVSEIVREQVLHVTGDEIPYVTAVVTERFEEVREDFARIYCVIVVERASQKKIIIGKGASSFESRSAYARAERLKTLWIIASISSCSLKSKRIGATRNNC